MRKNQPHLVPYLNRVFAISQIVALICVIITTVWTSTHFGYILFGNTNENPSIVLLILTSICLGAVFGLSLCQIGLALYNWYYRKDWVLMSSGIIIIAIWLTWFFKFNNTANFGFLEEVRVFDVFRWSLSTLMVGWQVWLLLTKR